MPTMYSSPKRGGTRFRTTGAEVPEHAGALRRNPVRDRLAQAAEHEVGQHQADKMPGDDGRRLDRVDDRAFRRGNGTWLQRAGIVGNVAGDDAAERVGRIGQRVAERHIEVVPRHPGGAGIVDVDVAVGDRQRRLQFDGVGLAVDHHRSVPCPLRQFGDLRLHRRARGIDDVVGELIEFVESELLHHLQQTQAADIVAVHQRIDVADRLHRLTGVGADHCHQRFIENPALDDLQNGKIQSLHENIRRCGHIAQPADIHDVAVAGQEPNQFVVTKAGRGQREVVGMPGAHPGVVMDEDIARLHRLDMVVINHMADRQRHRVDMTGRAGDGLCQHSALRVEHAGGEIAGFPHDGAEGRPLQRLRLFLDHRNQAAPHDLLVDQVENRFAHAVIPLRSITMEPRPSIQASKLSVTKVDVSSSAMMAGPDSRAPTESFSRR